MIKLLGQRVLIKKFDKLKERQEKIDKGGSGIILSDVKKKDEISSVEKGEIVDVSSELEDWKECKGQKCYFNAWAGDVIQYKEENYLIVHINDILAIYD